VQLVPQLDVGNGHRNVFSAADDEFGGLCHMCRLSRDTVEPDMKKADRISVGDDRNTDILRHRNLVPMGGHVLAFYAEPALFVFIAAPPAKGPATVGRDRIVQIDGIPVAHPIEGIARVGIDIELSLRAR
jgi:hypothetical protein